MSNFVLVHESLAHKTMLIFDNLYMFDVEITTIATTATTIATAVNTVTTNDKQVYDVAKEYVV